MGSSVSRATWHFLAPFQPNLETSSKSKSAFVRWTMSIYGICYRWAIAAWLALFNLLFRQVDAKGAVLITCLDSYSWIRTVNLIFFYTFAFTSIHQVCTIRRGKIEVDVARTQWELLSEKKLSEKLLSEKLLLEKLLSEKCLQKNSYKKNCQKNVTF